jgi:hypothetical protein
LPPFLREVVRPGSLLARFVIGVQQRARSQRKAAAADAGREPAAQTLQIRDAAVEVVSPAA